METSTLTILPDYDQVAIDDNGISYNIDELPAVASISFDWLNRFQPLVIKLHLMKSIFSTGNSGTKKDFV